MAMTPILPRPGILPRRVTPRLIPRMSTYASRVRVEVAAHDDVPGGTLLPKLISNTVGPDGAFHEYYMLMIDGDPEAVMNIYTPPDGELVLCEVARMSRARVDVYLDDTMICSFPETVDVGPWVGFMEFEIPIE